MSYKDSTPVARVGARVGKASLCSFAPKTSMGEKKHSIRTLNHHDWHEKPYVTLPRGDNEANVPGVS